MYSNANVWQAISRTCRCFIKIHTKTMCVPSALQEVIANIYGTLLDASSVLSILPVPWGLNICSFVRVMQATI
jgi:hypothetical protein